MNCLSRLGTTALLLLCHIQALFALDLPFSVQRPPRITKQSLEAYYLLPGGDKTLPCEAEGNPAVNESGRYFWKKDGEVLVTAQESTDIGSYGLTMPGPHGSLTFRGLQNSSTLSRLPYQGKYQCFAENSLGIALSNVVVVKIVKTVDLVPSVEDEIVSIQEGDSLTKPCVDLKYRRSDEEELEWKFSPVTFQNSNRIAQAPNRSIIFSNVAATDNGLKFYCSSKDLPTRITIESAHYTLVVQNSTTGAPSTYHPPEIVFPKAEQEIVTLNGEELSLACIATGNPSPSTHWNSQNRFELHDFNRTLRIAAVKYSDTGIYTCTAESEVGSMRRDVKVIVESKPYFANESKKPTDTVVEPGKNVKMKCEIRGRPTPTITWMKNGEVLSERHGVSLHLRNVTEDDTAVYQCVGENKHGTIMGQGYVNVLAVPPKPWPDFKRAFRKLEGTVLNLPCFMFSVTQKYDVVWSRYNQPQDNLLRDTRIHQGKDHRLVIKHINVDDTCIYQCNATNKYGSTTINVNVTVLFETTFKPAKTHYVVKAGDSVRMTVEVDHDPQMRDVQIYWTTTDAFRKGAGTTLTIVDAKASDAGKYIVEVVTELDKSVTYIYLTVQDRPEFPRNVTYVRAPNNNYTGTLSWSPPVNINFSPMTAYHIDILASTDLFEGKWRRLGNTTHEVKNFSIVALQPWVRYSFRVWAENGIGLSFLPSEPTKSYITPPHAPKVNPTGVNGEGTSPDTIVVRWNSVDSFEHAGPGFGYDVSWRLSSGGNWKKEFVEADEAEAYTITSTQTFTEYEIKVQSSNNEGSGPEPVSITTLSGQDIPLASPTNISTREDGEGVMLIKWQPVPTGAIRGIPTRYIIRCKDVVTNRVKKKFVSPDTISTTIKLEPYTEYEISITLENGAGESKRKSVLVRTKESIPEAPERFEVVKEMLNEIRLKWNKPTKTNGEIIGYKLKYQWEVNGKIMSTTLSLKVSKDKVIGLTPNTNFALTLCAETSAGVGTNCATTTARTIAPRKPEMPAISIITSQSSFNVTWTNSFKDEEDGIPVDGYVVQHRRKGKMVGNWTSSEFIPASILGKYLYTLTKLTPNFPYELRLLATNQYGSRASTSTVVKTSKKDSLSASGVGGQLWFIIVLCVAALVVLVIVIACFIRRRRGGTYPVSEKEEQLVTQYETQPAANSDYGRYSTSAVDGIENKTAEVDEERREAGPRLRGDSVSGDSIEAYGTGTTRDYDEDGSFIDQYGLDQHSGSKVSSPGSADTNSLALEQSHLISDFKQEAV